MRLYRVAQIHKVSGLLFGAVLLILAFTGFFLNHDNFNILWDIRFNKESLPKAVAEKTANAFTSFKVNSENTSHQMAGSRMGFFLSLDGGQVYQKTLSEQVLAIEPQRWHGKEDYEHLFVATTDGIYQSQNSGKNWVALALQGQPIESISVFDGFLYAVVDKRKIHKINIETGESEHLEFTPLAPEILPDQISLGRFVRDLHYGRGLFSGDSSLLINDFSAMVLFFLPVSGLLIYLAIKKIRRRKTKNKTTLYFWRNLHSNKLVIFSFIPIFLLLVTGVILDHPDFFRSFLKTTKLSISYLPPVYRDLSTDIWGIDYDGAHYRIGNRLGVFKSADLKNWSLDSSGFAWRMKRLGNDLYVGGMGSPNRLLVDHQWQILEGKAHMPRDFFRIGDETHLFTKHHHHFQMPVLEQVPVYHVLLALHDGEFFHEYWVFVNDLASIAALVLLITGFIKWYRRYHHPK